MDEAEKMAASITDTANWLIKEAARDFRNQDPPWKEKGFVARGIAVEQAATLIREQAERIKTLEDGLAQIRDETRGCSQDMGFCRENGPLGCALGDQCVCMPVHMIACAAMEGK